MVSSCCSYLFATARRSVSYMPRKKSYYEILGVKRDASDQEIKEAFVRKFQQLHPDGKDYSGKIEKSRDRYVPELTPTEQFMQLKQAYDVLKKPERRREYDREIRWSIGELNANELADVKLDEADIRNLRAGQNVLRNMTQAKLFTSVGQQQQQHFYDPLEAVAKEQRYRRMAFSVVLLATFLIIADVIYVRYISSTKKYVSSNSVTTS